VSSDTILSADEIFDIKLRKLAHITTIGCSSGRAKVSNCDDLLGLTAAFHYAGASSVVSALWPIHHDDGARFSLKFYESWMEQMKEPKIEENRASLFVNLAVAVQKAVLHVRRDEKGNVRVPYHWAGFTLSGSWLISKD
jgi:CHAT domain-containing protein